MVLYERSGDELDRGLVGYWKLDDLKGTQEDGIVAHYKLNDNAASTDIIDYKGGNTGTCDVNTDTNSVAGKISNAISMADGTDTITIPDSEATRLDTNSWSFSFWAKFGDHTWGHPFEKYNSGSDGWYLSVLPTSGRLIIHRYIGGVYEADWIDTSKNFDINEWVHVTFTYDGTNVKCYVNGTLRKTQNRAGDPIITYTGDLIIENDYPETDLIDDVRFYNRALNATEILSIYGDDSMIAHYKMNDNDTNTNVIDSKNGLTGTADANTSTLTNATGKINEALDFDGTSQKIVVDDNRLLDLGTGDFTVCAWVYPTTITGKQRSVIGKRTSSIDNWEFSIQSSGVLKAFVGNTAGNGNIQITSAGSISTGAWTHLMLIRSGATCTLYINNSADGTENNCGGNLNSVGGEMVIGSDVNSSGNDEFFEGAIDDIRIYKKALSTSERAAIYNSGTGTEETSILATGTETTELFRTDPVAVDRINFEDGDIDGCTNGEKFSGDNSMFFEGVDDNVVVSLWNRGPFNEFTISSWVKFTSLNADNTFLWAEDDTFILKYTTANKIKFYVDAADGATGYITSTTAVPLDTWTHISLVYDGATAKLYINGVKDVTEGTTTGATDSTSFIVFGANYDTTAEFLHGNLKNARVYNRALTDGQIKKLWRLKK